MTDILSVSDLTVAFKTSKEFVPITKDISFSIEKGQTLAIVGESGSGKSVTAKAIMQLLPKSDSKILTGEINFLGENLLTKSKKEIEKIRGKDIGMIFQNPMTSLNPTMSIGKQIAESIRKHQGKNKKAAYQQTLALLKEVGMKNPVKQFKQYPNHFSGGMRQRAMIAIAIACNPQLLIADEPTTALDVTIQAQILALIKKMQRDHQLALLFISHDLGVVANIADKVAVMYAGKIVEYGTTAEVFYNPMHPYTWGLLNSVPSLEEEAKQLISIPGSPPNLMEEQVGDRFASRNAYALEIDFKEEPPFFEVSPTHYAATWLLDKRAPNISLPTNILKRKNLWAAYQKGQVT